MCTESESQIPAPKPPFGSYLSRLYLRSSSGNPLAISSSSSLTDGIRGVAALNLNRDLGEFTGKGNVPRVGVNADQVIAFVVRRGFVCEDVPPHQVPHDEELGTSRDNWESEKILLHRSCCSVPH
jgi:hypothetical protein